MTKVSICIPAYNNEASVRRLLESIEKQRFQDYEVILTDDSDGDAVRKLAEEKKYVQYHKNNLRLGATANWNAAIAKSSGEYVKIMHHDDWFTDEDSLCKFVELMDKNPETALVFSGSRQVEGDNSYDRCISEADIKLIEEDYRNLYLGNTIGAPSAVMVRRSALVDESGALAVTYDEKLTWLVDMEYYMHILKEHPVFAYTTEPLISIGVGKTQLTESCRDDKELNVFEYGHIYDKYRLESEPEYRSKFIKILADAGKSAEDAAVYGIDSKEYQAEERRKLMSKITWKVTHLLTPGRMLLAVLFVFIISLLPILGLAGINHATGDDFGYGRLTHEAWQATHSLAEVFKASAETVRHYYYGWQGTWFSIFLFTLQPEVFSSEAYVIVPFLMLGVWLGATWLPGRWLLVKKCGLSGKYYGILFLLFAMAGIQFVPSTKSSIFWYNGTAHYVIPYAVALLAIYFYLRFTEDTKKTENAEGAGRKKGNHIGSYAGLLLCMSLLGGVNYQAALLAPIVIVLAAFFQWMNREKRKKILWCLLPLMLEGVGLVVSMTAPGNKARGGEDFGFSIGKAMETILSCFVRGVTQGLQYVTEHPLLLLLFAVAAVIIWQMVKTADKEKKYPLPAVFVGLSYCVYCAMFAPEIYAGVEVSGGVYNMNYYMFLFMVFGAMIYVEAALYRHLAWKQAGGLAKQQDSFISNSGKMILLPVMAVLAFVFLFVFRSDIKETTTYLCIDYVKSGQAADFKEQMKYQKEVLLDDKIKDVVLPAINDYQGPLMHMPLTENPEAWTNTVIKHFYGKDSVIAMPREAWMEMQGMK